jgi:serine/threonine protein kinase
MSEYAMLGLRGMPQYFTYEQLSVATEGFNEMSKLGQGAFGSVYRGVLPSSGIPVAVKRISNNSMQGEKEFMAEVSIISQLRHRNLIQILGWCKDVSNRNT